MRRQRTVTYQLGVVGLGYWPTQFEDVADGDLTFVRGADVVPYSDKSDVLDRLDIEREEYTNLTNSPHGQIRADFFDDIDAIQIASPISVHEPQTLQTIRESGDGTVVAVDKAYGPDLSSFHAVEAYSEATDTTVYPQLHYIRKQPTIRMESVLPEAVEEHGRITRVEASFVEERCEEDRDRTWLLEPEQGGIVMDWIHPIETLVYASDASFEEVHGTEGFLVEPSYSDQHPTAVKASLTVDGEHFDDALYKGIVGKGFKEGGTHKAMSITFEDGTLLHANYECGSVERSEGGAGSLLREDPEGEVIDRERLSGATPYEMMVEDLVDAIETGSRPLDASDQEEMYSAVHRINQNLFGKHYRDGEGVPPKDIIDDPEEIEALWEDARSVGRPTLASGH